MEKGRNEGVGFVSSMMLKNHHVEDMIFLKGTHVRVPFVAYFIRDAL